MGKYKNADINKRIKPTDVKFHFIREHVEKKTVALQYIPMSDMVADALTKPLQRGKHEKFAKLMGLDRVQDEGEC